MGAELDGAALPRSETEPETLRATQRETKPETDTGGLGRLDPPPENPDDGVLWPHLEPSSKPGLAPNIASPSITRSQPLTGSSPARKRAEIGLDGLRVSVPATNRTRDVLVGVIEGRTQGCGPAEITRLARRREDNKTLAATFTSRDGLEEEQVFALLDWCTARSEAGYPVGVVLAMGRNYASARPETHHAPDKLHVHAIVQGVSPAELERVLQDIAPESRPDCQRIEPVYPEEEGGVHGWIRYWFGRHSICGDELLLAGVYADCFALELAGLCGECREPVVRQGRKGKRYCSDGCRLRRYRRLHA